MRRGRGAGLGMRKAGCGSARRAPLPILRLCAPRPAPRQWAQRPGRRGELGVPSATQPHSSGRPGPQRLTRLGTGSPSENRVTVWGSLSRKRRTCTFCPQSGDTGTPGHSLPIPNEVSQSPSPRFIQSLSPPPGQPLREWGVEPHKGSACSPAPATITRFVRRENRGSGGQSLPSKRTHLLSPRRAPEAQSPASSGGSLPPPPLQTPKPVQAEVSGPEARLRDGPQQPKHSPINYFFFFFLKEAHILFSRN